MSETLIRVQTLVQRGEVRVSAHGYDELAEDGIFATDVIDGLSSAVVVEDYPDAAHGPCVLVLMYDSVGPVHAVWGVPRGKNGPATLVTAYRPDPSRWSADFLTRAKI